MSWSRTHKNNLISASGAFNIRSIDPVKDKHVVIQPLTNDESWFYEFCQRLGGVNWRNQCSAA